MSTKGAHLQLDDLIPDQRLLRRDPDRFGHTPIAAEVAALVASARTPLKIALFGPWGSGKSSFGELLRAELERNHPHVRFVRFDAWKGGGASLRRSFITAVARELEFDPGKRRNEPYFRGLYQSRRAAAVDFSTMWRVGLGSIASFTLLFVAATLVMTLVFGAASVITDEDFFGEIRRTVPRFLVASGGAAVVLAFIKALFDSASVQVEESAPSADEEFSELFLRLIEDALPATPADQSEPRLAVFIDELDRCTPEDVVCTLTALKTFLGELRCVFVVAADREALEQALLDVPQETPARAEAPYYSSAGAFIDKVFQHQVSLPALRARNLSRFAHDLTRDRAGLWGELAAFEDGRRLENLISALVPTHVSSPRRVKVLLNNFATTARVAQARGIDWRQRAEELAKLTVLQTEFPSVASDLRLEPRLVAALTAPYAEISGRLGELVARYRAANGGDAADPIMSRTDREGLARAQRENLRRYLLKTAHVPGPAADLFYLEGAAAVFGLADAELSDYVEGYAPDAPDEVLERLEGRTPEEMAAVLRLLAEMLDTGTVGHEMENVMHVVAALADRPESGVDDMAGRLAPTVLELLRNGRVGEQNLAGAVRIGAVAGGPVGRELATAALGDSRLWGSAEQARRVALMAGSLAPDQLGAVQRGLANRYPKDPDSVTVPFGLLQAADARRLLDAAVLIESVVQHVLNARAADLPAAIERVEEFVRPALEEPDDRMSAELAARVAEVLAEAPADDPALVAARFGVAASAAVGGVATEVPAPGIESGAALLRTIGDSLREQLALRLLLLAREPRDVVLVAESLGAAPQTLARYLAFTAGRRPPEWSTAVGRGLLDRDLDAAHWLVALEPGDGLSELVERAVALASDDSGRPERRRAAVDAVAAIARRWPSAEEAAAGLIRRLRRMPGNTPLVERLLARLPVATPDTEPCRRPVRP